eukprot:CAMPEP_0113462928 /NCGR_PEP_ID=MMETSP0014_2-20120614/12369_1 /TAXON_ID=2857 /ORGANISM="Nitzschia sp." /LENGTH=41 /DNA_ID=CAMNT_0000354855 /DNA_START=850 /DNA_END=975 /DNA_ORIENTATION=+ /assembly_acc=CAM_ASM_000159
MENMSLNPQRDKTLDSYLTNRLSNPTPNSSRSIGTQDQPTE